jgi:hypothetical protein
MTTEMQARGRSSYRRGTEAMREGALWLREHGAPHADRVTRHHASDFTGIGDLAVEMTVSPWDEIGRKAEQAKKDAEARGIRNWCVWKKRKALAGESKHGPGEWWAVTTFGQWWALHQELDALRAQVKMYREAFGVPGPHNPRLKGQPR